MIETGATIPEATLMEMTAEGPKAVTTGELFQGKAVLFGVPGAYTPTCNDQHVPSFVANMDALKAKGVDTVACLSVNDPFVMGAWGESTGAAGAGIRMLGDPSGAFVRALGLDFTAEPVGLIGRAKRFAAVIEGGRLTALAVEDNPGEAGVTTGEAMLAHL